MSRSATSHRYVMLQLAGRGLLMAVVAFAGPTDLTDGVDSFKSRLAMFLPLHLDFSGL